MSASVASHREATLNDLYRIKGKAELVGGRIQIMSPSGYVHGKVIAHISNSLYRHQEGIGGGEVLTDSVGFVVDLPGRRSFSPDVAWYTGQPPENEMDFVPGAPVFAVEVRSKEDYGPRAERIMAQKRADYFAAGTQVIWDVDMLSEVIIRKYTAETPDSYIGFLRDDEADAEPAVPGWRLAVERLFR